MVRLELIDRAKEVLAGERKRVLLPSEGKAVFVGDTHGDLNATETVLKRYFQKPYRLVFLGDYVDRGDQSEENIQTLLEAKCEHPDRLFLLAGNHEGFMVKEFYPANFWTSLSDAERKAYGDLFAQFPLAATSDNGIMALHGGLPDLSNLDAFDRIAWGDESWERIVWGDFGDSPGEALGHWGGRPQFGRDYFERVMGRYERRVLVRSHQPHADRFMFKGRCVTIFTSRAYLSKRTILIADLEKQIRTEHDLVIEEI